MNKDRVCIVQEITCSFPVTKNRPDEVGFAIARLELRPLIGGLRPDFVPGSTHPFLSEKAICKCAIYLCLIAHLQDGFVI